MKYALFVKLGGELVSTDDVTYEDHKYFLKCPNCKELVFLRKEHIRKSVQIPASFVHHKAIPEISICEARVNSYSVNDFKKIESAARGQRIDKLRISMWKYLKTNLSLNLSQWSKNVNDIKKFKAIKQIIDYGIESINENIDFIINHTFNTVENILFTNDEKLMQIVPIGYEMLNKFLKENRVYWKLHCKIAKEALELFLTSAYLRDIKYRLLCCLCHPSVLQKLSFLLDTDMGTDDWKSKFISYLTLQINFIFLTVDWIKVFNVEK